VPKSSAFDNDWLRLVFNAAPIANIADNAAAAPLTNLYVALHTADPGAVGTEATNEISYTGYARVAVARSVGGWTVTGSSVSPVAAVIFGVMTAGAGGTVTHWSVGVASAGATKILYSGAVLPTILVAVTVTPQLTTATAVSES
jgi:hypothetical protein